MRKGLVLLLAGAAFTLTAQSDTSIILSEVMFKPESGDNEFIELFNLSPVNSVNISGYKVKYYNSSPDIIIDAGYGTLLPPRSYAVVFENDYDISNGQYAGLVPQDALILKITDNNFGSSGMSNTSGRLIRLINPAGDTVSYYTYTADNENGYSDEKKILNNQSHASNWGNSILLNGTPGFLNSISPMAYDLEVSGIAFSPAAPLQGDELTISTKIKNIGSEPASSYYVNIYDDLNCDSTGTAGEMIYSGNYSNLPPNDSIIVSASAGLMVTGTKVYLCEVNYTQDENPANNMLIEGITISPPPVGENSIVLNEIMYSPPPDQGEWVELYNRSDTPLNLKDFRLGDLSGSAIITKNDMIIEAGSYCILARDSGIINYYTITAPLIIFNLPLLNNSGDAVVLKDASGNLIDSLLYDQSWGGSKVSLERISTELPTQSNTNWGSSISVNKGTPGLKNSISPKEFDLSLSSFIPVSSYIISGDRAKFKITILNRGNSAASNIKFNLYNDYNKDSIPAAGELIKVQNFSYLSISDSICFEIETGALLPGLHLFIGEAEYQPDEDKTNNIRCTSVVSAAVNEYRNDIVINEIMHSPAEGEPEWLELFNRSNKTINLKNYSLADNSDTVKIIPGSYDFYPGKYLIIADDSSLLSSYSVSSDYIITSIPALNNSGDRLILLDSLFRVIDSTEYKFTWGGTKGRSLERITAGGSSIDSANWQSCRKIKGGTPGHINTVSQKQYDIAVLRVYSNPAFPAFGDDVELSAEVKNLGLLPINFKLQLFSDTNLDSIPDNLIEEITVNNLTSGDSLRLKFTYLISNLNEKKGFYINAVCADEDTGNNYLYFEIMPGSSFNSVVINEIMYCPAGEPEWIELYNNSTHTINLKGWRVKDNSSSAGVVIKHDIVLLPGGFAVLARDSSIYSAHTLIPAAVSLINLPALNNDEDAVILKDERSSVIDSVFYSNKWSVIKSNSLERRSAAGLSGSQLNWNSSIDIEGSTPGRVNSITVKEYDIAAASFSTEPVFPLPGEEVGFTIKIINYGTKTAGSFEVTVKCDENKDGLFERIISNKNYFQLRAGDSLFFVTDSKLIINDTLSCLLMIHFPGDEDTLNNNIAKKFSSGYSKNSIQISEVMYNPSEGLAEWIEFYNNSTDSINLKGWIVSDLLTTARKDYITEENYRIGPGEFFITAADSSGLTASGIPVNRIFISNFGTLGNTNDGVVLYDFRNAVIDSLKYSSKWGGGKNLSLERISFKKSTTDSSNWISSLSPAGSTPGKQNAAAVQPHYSIGNVLINEIMYEPAAGGCEYLEFINTSQDTINVGGWRISAGADEFTISFSSVYVSPGEYFVFASDSSIFVRYPQEESAYFISGRASLGLSSQGEPVILKDMHSNFIDSLTYFSEWHSKSFRSTKDRSLERISFTGNSNDMNNWSTCVSPLGGTPGKENSIFIGSVSSGSALSVSPNPFSPDNDGYEDNSIISYNLTHVSSTVRVKIYDSKGRLVRMLLNNYHTGSKGSVVFDGCDEYGNPLRMGIYIILLEAFNELNRNVQVLKIPVVVARKLN